MENIYPSHMDDTDSIELPEELNTLIEHIAEGVHDVWVSNRIADGWTYGKERNEALKQHPCLVAYKDLPDEEKEYDRNTALTTLRLVVKMGFKISKLQE